MRMSRFAGANGRYTPSCEKGVCARTGNRATSKLESDIFTLLDYILGPGKQDVHTYLSGNRPCRIDMLFPALGPQAVIVEYDGAHWHEGKEERDWSKSCEMQEGWYSHRDNLVVRIREQPLPLLDPLNVPVPPRAKAVLCVRVTVLHLLHSESRILGDRLPRVLDFLRSSSQPLARDEVLCGGCRRAASRVIPDELLVPTLRRERDGNASIEDTTASGGAPRRRRRNSRRAGL